MDIPFKPLVPNGLPDPTNWSQRVGPLSQVPRLLQEYGVDAASILGQVGLPPDALSDPEARVPYLAAMRLLTKSVQQTGCEHFALAVGKVCHLQDLGIPGQLVRHCATVGEALRTLVVYQQLNAQGGAPYLLKETDTFVLGYAVYHPVAEDAYLAMEALMAIIANIVRELAGYDSIFVELTLPRLSPLDVSPYRQHFHCPIRFSASQAALRFPASLMRRRIPGADAAARDRLQEEADRLLVSTFEINLYRSLSMLLMTGLPSASGNAVAQQLSLHRRTLNRRLKLLGTTFRTVLDDVRFNTARQLLQDTELSIAELAMQLGYTESSAFARAFRRWSGQAPHDWRATAQHHQ